MVNMMMDILQYVPYALFAGAILLLLLVFTAVTINFFRKAERELRNDNLYILKYTETGAF